MTVLESLKKRTWIFNILRSALALCLAFFLVQIQLDYIESFFYDVRVRLRPAPMTSGRIATVALDIKTQEELKTSPEAKHHIELFKQLQKAKPKAVVYLQSMEEVIGGYEELEVLAEEAAKLNFYAADDTRLPEEGLEDNFKLLPPLQNLAYESAPKTSDSSSFAKDGVSRRLIISMLGEPLLHTKLANSINGNDKISDYRGAFKFKRTTQAYINFRPKGTYRPLSFVDIINGDFNHAELKDKIVIIGRDTRADTSDYVMTPYSRDNTAMSRLELHANILDTLILDNAPIRSPFWLDFLATSLIAILTIFVVMAVRPGQGLMILLMSMVAYFLFCTFFFASFGLWLDMTHPLLAIFICYYFFIPYRLIIENRKSWEYYQKNALLTQVEELKSNFLRMMSHDLKTPVARIQGMTEVALSDDHPMSEKQKSALTSIEKSTEELSHFFSSILNLGRIEAKDIKLQLKSKDINALLKEIINKCDYLAVQKNIRIVTEFEPMFSLKIDEDLIRQVFTNLLENAIKYSPEDSSVLISTEEVDGQVRVQIADQGIGIPKEEIPNLFSKFFRAKSAVNSEVKGSGLGLYLSRYFVDLHRGRIHVESEPEKGSTFTVELPMSL